MYTLKISVSIDLQYAHDKTLFDKLADADIRDIELVLCAHWREDIAVQEAYLRGLEQGVESFLAQGVRIRSVHIPFGPFWDFCRLNEAERSACVARTLALEKRLKPYTIPYLVVHTNGNDFPADGNRDKGIASLRRSLAELGACDSMTVCVENLPRNCLGNTSEEMLRIVDGLPVACTFDVNHVFLESIPHFVEALGPRIKTLHVSDADTIDEKHWLPGDGIIDFQSFVEALEHIGYTGTFNYETHNTPDSDFTDLRHRHDLIFSEYNRCRS